MNLVATRWPTQKAVTLKALKRHLTLDDTVVDFDTLLNELIDQAAEDVEGQIGARVLVDTTYVLWLNARETGSPILLPVVPVIWVDEIATYDVDDVETIVEASNYRIGSYAGEVLIESVSSGWSADRTYNGMKITFRAGHVAVATADGAGAPGTTLNIHESMFHASRSVGMNVRDADDPAGDLNTTISAVTDENTVTIGSSTWSDNEVVLIGKIPYDIDQEIKRQAVFNFRHRGGAEVGTNVTLVETPHRSLDRWHYGLA